MIQKATIRTDSGVGWLEIIEEVYLGEVSERYIEKLTAELEKQGYRVSLVSL